MISVVDVKLEIYVSMGCVREAPHIPGSRYIHGNSKLGRVSLSLKYYFCTFNSTVLYCGVIVYV
jgi:hypothetical protein